MFHFTALEKLCFFFLNSDLIPKFHLLKPNVLLSIMVKIMMGKDLGNIQWPKNVGNHHY